jgi:uncharacterized protein (DUF1697 family)
MRQVLLLRGINIGPRNRIAMPALRELLTAAGYEDVSTYVQSGNVVLGSDAPPEELARDCGQRINEAFGLQIAVVARTRDELAAVVDRDPLREIAVDPKRYQVSFMSAEPDPDALRSCAALATPQERLVAIGRELYVWHPAGIGRSKLWSKLAGPALGVTATARNWTTVNALLAMAGDESSGERPTPVRSGRGTRSRRVG